ncbi:hypothetical protein GGR51DRAFT_19061 [Nemania sp. FL0031]|nr:hypothetical protein GGR51DRAFT_19061 [Nemania sp. FL0031]
MMAIWEILTALGCRRELRPVAQYLEFGFGDEEEQRFIGGELNRCDIDGVYDNEEDLQDWLKEDWSKCEGRRTLQDNNVFWLNESTAKYKESQIRYIGYGNEHSLQVIYSTCAIIAAILRYESRKTDFQA